MKKKPAAKRRSVSKTSAVIYLKNGQSYKKILSDHFFQTLVYKKYFMKSIFKLDK